MEYRCQRHSKNTNEFGSWEYLHKDTWRPVINYQIRFDLNKKYMDYSDNILKTFYIKKNGYDVIDSGSVIIEGIEHRINNGWVYCNTSLQHRSFNTTPKNSICPKCFPDQTVFKNKQMKVKQLTLF